MGSGSARSTISSCRITGIENHPGLCKTIQIRRFDEIAPLNAHIFPAKIVGKNKNYVGFCRSLGQGRLDQDDSAKHEQEESHEIELS